MDYMEKLDPELLPDALVKWTFKLTDYLFNRYARTLGYTLEELSELSQTNEKVCRAMILVIDSIFEKTFYQVASGNINTELAEFSLNYYDKFLGKVRKKVIEFDLSLKNDSDYCDDDEEDTELTEENEVNDNA